MEYVTFLWFFVLSPPPIFTILKRVHVAANQTPSLTTSYTDEICLLASITTIPPHLQMAHSRTTRADSGGGGMMEEDEFNTMDGPEDMVAGYRRFRASTYKRQVSLYRELGLGQEPKVMLIACADSRADPSAIFDAAPGQLFVVRNVANLVPPYEPNGVGVHGVSAALEYAVTVLKVLCINAEPVLSFSATRVPLIALIALICVINYSAAAQYLHIYQVRHIVVMGHGGCGGVAASLAGGECGEFIGPWVRLLTPARDRVLCSGSWNPQYALELEGIDTSLANLMTFPFVREAVAERGLAIHGAWFAIHHGELHWRNEVGGGHGARRVFFCF